MIHSGIYQTLLRACQQMSRHRQALAKPVMEALVLRRVDPSTSNSALLSHIVVEALLRRLDRTLMESKNIYVEQFNIPQIEMFYRMAQAYPQIDGSHQIANQYLRSAMAPHREVALLEIGIGKGRQVSALLDSLSEVAHETTKIHLVAIDPDPTNLLDSAQLLGSRPAATVTVDFHPVPGLIEQLSESTFEMIRGLARRLPLVINSSYTLHHTAHTPGNDRERVSLLRRLAALNPIIFTLIEPSSDHDTESLPRRFHNCWQHFGTVFELIDESGLSEAERFVVKEKFFGREIRDIFGTSDRLRCERHEEYERWLLKLHRAGFRPYPRVPVEVSLPDHCQIKIDEGLVRFGYQGLTLVAVMAQYIQENPV